MKKKSKSKSSSKSSKSASIPEQKTAAKINFFEDENDLLELGSSGNAPRHNFSNRSLRKSVEADDNLLELPEMQIAAPTFETEPEQISDAEADEISIKDASPIESASGVTQTNELVSDNETANDETAFDKKLTGDAPPIGNRIEETPSAEEIYTEIDRNDSSAPETLQSPTAPGESTAETARGSGLAYGAAISLFGAVIVMLIIGWLADRIFGSSPWGIVVGIILGAIIGFYQFFKINSQIFKK